MGRSPKKRSRIWELTNTANNSIYVVAPNPTVATEFAVKVVRHARHVDNLRVNDHTPGLMYRAINTYDIIESNVIGVVLLSPIPEMDMPVGVAHMVHGKKKLVYGKTVGPAWVLGNIKSPKIGSKEELIEHEMIGDDDCTPVESLSFATRRRCKLKIN